MALTLNRVCGFESGSSTAGEIQASTAISLTDPSTFGGTGEWCARLDASSSVCDVAVTNERADAGNYWIVGWHARYSGTLTSYTEFFSVVDPSNSTWFGQLGLSVTNHYWSFRSGQAAGTTHNATWGPSVDTDYYLELYFNPHSTSSDVKLYVNGTLAIDATGVNCTSGVAGDPVTLRYKGRTNMSHFVDDIYVLTDAATTDRWGKINIVPYQTGVTTATSDYGSNLDTGTWQAVNEALSDTPTTAEFTSSNVGGGVDMDRTGTWPNSGEARGGPNGDSTYGGLTVKAIGGWWRVSRSGGGATAHYGTIGNNTDGVIDSYDFDPPTSPPTDYTFCTNNSTYFPTSSEYLRAGFRQDGGQDFTCGGFLAWVVYEADTATPRNVTCTTEVISWDGTNHDATVTIGTPRNVTCTTEAISVTESAAQIATDTRNITTAPRGMKKWKGLDFQTVMFDASEWRNPGSTDPANAFDGSTSTSYSLIGSGSTTSTNVAMGRGISVKLGPIGAASDVPLRVEVRVYTSDISTGSVGILAGFRDGTDFDFTGYETFHPDRGVKQLGTLNNTSAAWSSWMVVPNGIWGWSDPHNNTETSPLTWEAINNQLTVGFRSITGSAGKVHAVQLRVTSGPANTMAVGYFDGSNGSPTQTDTTDWTNMTNADDGSTSTFASAAANASGWMEIFGTNITKPAGASDEIIAVYYRFYGRLSWPTANDGISLAVGIGAHDHLPADCVPILDSEGGSNYGCKVENEYFFPSNATCHGITTSASGFWSPWYAVDINSVKWYEGPDPTVNYCSWDRFDELSANIHSGGGWPGTTAEIARVDIAVLAAPTNANRKGSTTKFNRIVTGTTEVAQLDGTTHPATVDRQRGVNGTTEVLTATENAATVSFATPRNVVCTTEVVTLPGTLSAINRERGVTGATEVTSLASTGNVNRQRSAAGATQANVLTESASTTNRERGVVSATEATVLTESASTTNRKRGVVGATEATVLTEASATVSTSTNRIVTCTTEAISLTETPGAVNGTRIVASTAEITALVENAASTNRTRGVGAAAEAAVVTSSGNVNKPVVVTGATEAATLAESAATINRKRGVTAATEAVSLAESAATVVTGANRIVTCTTEVVSLTENASTANRERGVSATTETLQIAEAAAPVNASRVTLGVTESSVLTESLAAANRERGVTGATQANVLTEAAATVSTSTNRVVTCTTEVLSLTESAGAVNGTRIAAATAEITALVENAASLNITRSVTCNTEVVALAEAAADVNFNRVVTGSTEVLNLSENAATIDTTASNNPRNVNCTTEVAVLTEATSSVSASRVAQCATEASVLTETAATVTKVKNAQAATEAVVLTETQAAVNRTRAISANTATALMVEATASVFRGTNLDVTALTAVIALTQNSSVVTNPRHVQALTEVVQLLANPALANFPKLVQASTEVLLFVGAQATITKLPANVQPGSMIYVDPGTEGAIFVDNLVIQRYD